MEGVRCTVFLIGSLWIFGLASGQYRDIEVCYDNATLCFSAHTNRAVSLKIWQEADEFCRNRSATLPIVTSTHLQYTLGEFLTATDLTIDNVWLAAKGKTYPDSVYHWLNGNALKSGIWQDIAIMIQFESRSDLVTGGVSNQMTPSLTTFNESTLLYATGIHQELRYLCQFKVPTDCTGSDGFLDGGICYMVFQERLNWFMARNRCLQRGGDLAQLSTELLNTINDRVNMPESTYPSTPNGLWIGLRKFWWIWKSGGEEQEVMQSYFEKWISVSNPADYCITTNYRDLWGWTPSDCGQRYFAVCQRSTPTPTTTVGLPTLTDSTTPMVSLPAWAVGLICGLVGAFYIASLIVVGCVVYRKCSRKESEDLYPQIPPSNRVDAFHRKSDADDEYELPQMTHNNNDYTPSPYEM